MATVTIQIGNSDDNLTQKEWNEYVTRVDMAVRRYADVHFFGGSPNWFPWQNAAWVANANKTDLTRLSLKLHEIREKHGQESIAWTQGETAFI